jgi:hypothetical protein
MRPLFFIAALILAAPLAAQTPTVRAPLAGAATANTATTLAPPARFGALTLAPRQQNQLRTMRAGRMDFACSGRYCVCDGDTDCNDMFTTNVCGVNAVCIGTLCFCDRR